MKRNDQPTLQPTPRAHTTHNDDNKPVIPKIPNPRKPSTTPTQPTPTTGVVYTYAVAVADCPVHRAQHEEAEARYAEFQAENAASIRRRDRLTLSLRAARTTAVTA